MYTTDNTVPTSQKGIEYTGPIEIDDDTHIIAVAYENSKKSMYTSSTYEIVYDGGDNDFDVTDDGVILSYNGDKTNIIVPETVGGVTVSAIGDNVFNNSTLKNITLPYTVKRIGVSAFANSNLASITAKGVVDVDNGAFEGCQSLVSVDMESVKTVGNRCFKNCKKLTEIPFDETVEEIGSNSFSFTSLSSAEFPNVETVECAFEGSKVVVANLPLVKNTYRTFTDCSLLSSVNMPSLENIGSFTFDNCTSLSNFSMNNVKTVDSYAFRGTPITNANLKKCTSLGTQAFFDCEELTSVNIPNVKVIEPKTFSYCYSLQNIDMKNVEKFDGLNEKYFTDCISLKGLYLPKSINLPNISWSSSMQSSIAFGTKPKLSFVFAPKAFDVANSNGTPFMSKCTNLEYAVLTSANSLENVENINSCVFYFGSNLGALPDCTNAKFKVVAPDNSYAVKWAKDNNCDYVNSSSVKISSVSSTEITYNAEDFSSKLPIESVKALWSAENVNAKKSDNTIVSLLDFNGDGVLNGKDYFYLNRL